MKSKELTWFYMFGENRRAIENMSPETVKKVLLLLYDYFETGNMPELQGEEYFAFFILKKGVELAKEHFYSKREGGKKGADARWNKEKQAPEPDSTEQPKQETSKEPDKEKPKPKKQAEPKTTKGFKPPTLEEIRAYCIERGNNIDPEYFFNYQVARDWILSNGKKMKDWKATIRYWESNDYNTGRKSTEDLANDTSGYGDDSYLWNN